MNKNKADSCVWSCLRDQPRSFLSFLSAPANPCDSSPGLLSSIARRLGTVSDFCRSLRHIFISVRHVGACVISAQPEESAWTGTEGTAGSVAVRASPQGPVCWRFTWVQGGHSYLLGAASFRASTQVASLPHLTVCIN